ncbi:MAG: hypothetical protein QXK37_01055 [Candidatus Woesearchaeota archaeon]
MSRSFTRHYTSYRWLSAALIIFIFAFSIIFNLVAYISGGVPVGFVISNEVGGYVETNASIIWLVMHFMMLVLLFIVIALVAFAFDAKKEPRQFVKRKIVWRNEAVEMAQQKAASRERIQKTFARGFKRKEIHEHLLEKGHDVKDIEKVLDKHKIK